MTKLKIEVTGVDDVAALEILRRLRLSMIDSNANGEFEIQCPGYDIGDTIGTATATVEREQGGGE